MIRFWDGAERTKCRADHAAAVKDCGVPPRVREDPALLEGRKQNTQVEAAGRKKSKRKFPFGMRPPKNRHRPGRLPGCCTALERAEDALQTRICELQSEKLGLDDADCV